MSRRVVVTGVGAVAPRILGSRELLESLSSGRSSVRIHPGFASSADTPFFGAFIDDDTSRRIDADLQGHGLEPRAMSGSARLACHGAWQAWQHAGLPLGGVTDALRAGVFCATWRRESSAERLFRAVRAWDPATRKISFARLAASASPDCPDWGFAQRQADAATLLIARHLGLQAAHTTSVDACAAGGMSVGNAFRSIRCGALDLALAGGAAALFEFMPLSLFHLLGALAPLRSEPPERVSCPFTPRHRGFVMGENAGFLVLESRQHALQRGAHILAEIRGSAQTLEAFHPTASPQDGSESARCMQAALDDAGVPAEAIDHINTHGTSTPSNDTMEIQGIRRVFGKRVIDIPLTSTKSALGHSLTGSGAIEAVISVLSLQHQLIPPTLNFDRPCEAAVGCDVVNTARPAALRHVLSNSFGFGGENTALIFSTGDAA